MAGDNRLVYPTYLHLYVRVLTSTLPPKYVLLCTGVVIGIARDSPYVSYEMNSCALALDAPLPLQLSAAAFGFAIRIIRWYVLPVQYSCN